MSPTAATTSLRTRATWAKLLLGISAAFATYLAYMTFTASTGNVEPLDNYEGVLGWSLIFGLATAVAFITWSYRAHANLTLLGRRNVRHSDQATIWWWIVPIAFLFMPFRVIYETCRGSSARADDGNWREAQLDPYTIWWTLLFLGGMILSRVGESMAFEAVTESEFTTALGVMAFAGAALAGAAGCAIGMVERITSNQEQLASVALEQRVETEMPAVASVGATSGAAAHVGVSDGGAYCRQCGTAFRADDRFCGGCGRER